MISLLRTESLSVGYSNEILFDKLNLQLVPGELVCFMGPNGVGKSTLIRTLAGLQTPLDGTITYAGHENELPKQVAVVLTDRITTNNLTVYELICFGRYPYIPWNLSLNHEDKTLIKKIIGELNLELLQNKKIDELSDGQLQLVMIARAWAQDTPIILLDEPTAHLDLNNRVEIINLLRKMAHESGKSILMSTHDLDLALQTADLIWLTIKKNITTGLPEDLVLSGKFDDVFQFKGFDLKSGKVYHHAFQKIALKIEGDEYYHLWTKNALERNGYSLQKAAPIEITIRPNNNRFIWEIITSESRRQSSSIKELIEALKEIQ